MTALDKDKFSGILLLGILLHMLVAFACSSNKAERFANWKQSVAGTAEIEDFSYAGYDFGESDLPIKHDLDEFKIEDYGAIANDSLSDREAIEKAIEAAETNGGGVILFGSGTYQINDKKGSTRGIEIRQDNIILRGLGSDSSGTILFMKEPLEPLNPSKIWTTPAIIQFIGSDQGIDIGHLSVSVKKGDFHVTFDDVHGLKKGDVVNIFAQGTFLNERFLKGRKTRKKWTKINQSGVSVSELHKVDSIAGDKVIFRSPILFDIGLDEPWNFQKMHLIEGCGFENIRFVGNFLEPFIHHKNAYHDGGFKAISMNRTLNSWVSNSDFVNVNEAVCFKGCLSGTIVGCETLGNGGHSSFGMQNSTRGLIAYCKDKSNQWHGPNSSHSSVATVILRFTGINRGIDLHGAFPRVTLFDDCEMAGFDGDSVGRASHGAHFSNLPNHLDGLVFWNFVQTDRPRPGFNFWDLLDSDSSQNYGPLSAVDPILIGFQGKGTTFQNAGVIESFGTSVSPQSLYLTQLLQRTNQIPDYLLEE